MRSSFPDASSQEIVIECGFHPEGSDALAHQALRIAAEEGSAAEVKWFEKGAEDETQVQMEQHLRSVLERVNNPDLPDLEPEQLHEVVQGLAATLGPDVRGFRKFLRRKVGAGQRRERLYVLVGDFAIFNANSLALRGLQTVSRRAPLGIYGETLDVAIAGLKPDVWADLLERAKCVSWLEDIVVDPTDQLKYQGHKLGKSQSTLYFHDKHMPPANNVFSAENVNEGVLHVLFHLTLFVSEGTPKILGIDNIDTALNPQLCRDLMKQICELAAKHDKQALITTHNPATLDGLNLHDDEQRLFVVYRNDEGHTVTKRIRAKQQPEGQKLKLSELWMRGHLGGIPRNF